MDNNSDNNIPETTMDPKPETTYTDPNAGATYTYGQAPKQDTADPVTAPEAPEAENPSPDTAQDSAAPKQETPIPEKAPQHPNPGYAPQNTGYQQPGQQSAGYQQPGQQNAGYQQPGPGYTPPNTGYQNNNANYNGYNNQYQNYQAEGMDTTPLSMGEWLLTLLAGIIPCAGLVLYCIWAFGKSGNLHRRNFCRAYLILEVVGIILGILFLIVMMAIGIGNYSNPYYY